ncbi:hypothetical protein [Paenibacillus aquistagni]|uniref:Uncharacterized protein n=1 Tax=Paenibacillus aquistagni TaxID=1852522 RepID=A0A1X7LSK5_9BACL|nr:hypothetical protein [Paenibacillus aquistagni]SMG56467.1 hypothetical protein SAMN06295960_4136 [Paenibacillus aquistagni]
MQVNRLEFERVVKRDRIVHAIDTEKVKCDKTSIQTMYKDLNEKKPDVLKRLYSEYKYAGKTAVNIFEAPDFPFELNNKDAFLKHIKGKLGINSRVTGIEFRPVLSLMPKINFVDDLGDAILIQWVSGEPKVGWSGYEVVEQIKPSFEIMLIRFGSPVFVEVRSGYTNSRKFLNHFEQLISTDERGIISINWLPVTQVTEKEAEKIASILNAGLLESEVIGEGCIGRLSLSAAPGIEDLNEQQQYRDMVSGRAYLSQVFHVNYQELDTGYSTKVKFRINHKGGFEFKNKVSERIIRRILDVFVEVRYGFESKTDSDGNEAVGL